MVKGMSQGPIDVELDVACALLRYHLDVCQSLIYGLQESGAPQQRLVWAFAELDQLHAALEEVITRRRHR